MDIQKAVSMNTEAKGDKCKAALLEEQKALDAQIDEKTMEKNEQIKKQQDAYIRVCTEEDTDMIN